MSKIEQSAEDGRRCMRFRPINHCHSHSKKDMYCIGSKCGFFELITEQQINTKVEDTIKKHCNTEYSKSTGEEMVYSALSSVCIAMDEYRAARMPSDEEILKRFAKYFNSESYGSIEGWIIEEFIRDELSQYPAINASQSVKLPSEEEIKLACPQELIPRISCWIQGAKWVIDYIKTNSLKFAGKELFNHKDRDTDHAITGQ
ncbi:MAG: hypothetical protein IMZ64_11865 [Bacteroidetes bacterium]|nr:hypothetical protein [Bacteroidota bacterium]